MEDASAVLATPADSGSSNNGNAVIDDDGNSSGLGTGTIIVLVILLFVVLGGIATGIYFLVRVVKKKKTQKRLKKAAAAAYQPAALQMPQLSPMQMPQLSPLQMPQLSPLQMPWLIREAPRYAAPTQMPPLQMPWLIREVPRYDAPTLYAPSPEVPAASDELAEARGSTSPYKGPPTAAKAAQSAKIQASLAAWALQNKAVAWALQKKNKPTAGKPGKPTTAPPKTTALPLPSPSSRGPPWNITDTDNPKAMSLSNGAFKFSYTKGIPGAKSGGAFKANPFKKLPSDTCTLSYSVFFPAGFNYRKGGKLPGVCLGTSPKTCAKGKDWSATTGSLRVTFKEGGTAVGYAYMAIAGGSKGAWDMQSAKFKGVTKKDKDGTDAPGLHVWHNSGLLKFKSGQWNPVALQMALNTPGSKNGRLSLTVNGKTETLTDVVWRTSASVKIQSVNFVSFFGGSGPEAASLVDTYSMIKDIRFGV